MNSGTVLAGTDGLISMTNGARIDARDRCDVADEIEVKFLIQRRVDRGRRGGKQERITIRRRTNDCLGANIGPRAGSIFNDERLAKPLRQPLTDQACENVSRAAGSKANDNAHRARRIGLCPRDPRHRRQRRSTRGQMQKLSDGEVSSSPLRLAKVHSITSLARQVMAFMCARRPAGAL